MDLYPNLEAAMSFSKKKADFKKVNNYLAFSQASQSTTDFETINDKVLREMNERAKKQLENKVQTTVNPFKLGDSTKSRSPQKAATPISRKRFSTLHKTQFNRMESIESHPKVVAKSSRVNLRQQYQQEAQGASPAKRGQVKAEESPTKRLRREPAPEPTPPATRILRPSLRPQSSKASLRQAREPAKAVREPQDLKEPSKLKTPSEPRPSTPKVIPDYMKLSKTSERIRARASRANLRGPTLERPDMKEVSRPRTLRASVSCREIPRPSTASDDSTMDIDSSMVSQDSPSAEPPISISKEQARRRQLELTSVPKHTPSYARPTVSALRRSQSQQLPKNGVQHTPSRVASMLGAISRVPRKNPDAKR